MGRGKLRYYLDRNGYLVEVEQNPCGCHPLDLMVTYANPMTHGKGKSVSYSWFRNQQQINALPRTRKWTRLK